MSDYNALNLKLQALETSVEKNAELVTEFTESSRFQLSEQNVRIGKVEDSMNSLRVELQGRIDRSQRIILSAIGAVGVVLAAIQVLLEVTSR